MPQALLEADFVRIAGSSRTNLKIVDDSGRLTELNELGPEIKPEEWQEMEQKLSGYGLAGNIAVLSGSLPAGLGNETYQKLSAMLRRRGAAVFLDADGEALKCALESAPDEVPDYIKPNTYELLQYFGMTHENNITEAKLAELCQSLLRKGIKLVALSMGEAGALFVNNNGAWRSPALMIQVRSTVGAGDSMTGALVYGFEQGLPDEQCFALAMAASAGACTTAGTNPPDRELVQTLLAKTRMEKIA